MKRRRVEPIVGEGILLRMLREEDLPLTREWRNLPHIRTRFFHSDEVSEAQHRNWYSRYLSRPQDYVFVIEETSRLNRPVGQISLLEVDFPASRAEVGHLMIGVPAARGRRLGTTVLQTVTDFGLFSWGLEEIHAYIKPDNLTISLITREVGFTVLGEDGGRIHIVRKR